MAEVRLANDQAAVGMAADHHALGADAGEEALLGGPPPERDRLVVLDEVAALEPVVGPHPHQSVVQVTARVDAVRRQVGIDQGRPAQALGRPADHHDGRPVARLVHAAAVHGSHGRRNGRAPVVGGDDGPVVQRHADRAAAGIAAQRTRLHGVGGGASVPEHEHLFTPGVAAVRADHGAGTMGVGGLGVGQQQPSIRQRYAPAPFAHAFRPIRPGVGRDLAADLPGASTIG